MNLILLSFVCLALLGIVCLIGAAVQDYRKTLSRLHSAANRCDELAKHLEHFSR